MAEINSVPDKSGKAGVRKSKKLSTKIDLTPMVDLGFLLITFFILTTKWSESKAADLAMPADGPPTEICESCALTVIPNGEDKIFYYHGNFEAAMKNGENGITNFNLDDGIGKIIREAQASLLRKGIKKTDFMLLIKPTDEAGYGNVVDLLDEVLINDVRHYAIVKLEPAEKEIVARKGL